MAKNPYQNVWKYLTEERDRENSEAIFVGSIFLPKMLVQAIRLVADKTGGNDETVAAAIVEGLLAERTMDAMNQAVQQMKIEDGSVYAGIEGDLREKLKNITGPLSNKSKDLTELMGQLTGMSENLKNLQGMFTELETNLDKTGDPSCEEKSKK